MVFFRKKKKQLMKLQQQLGEAENREVALKEVLERAFEQLHLALADTRLATEEMNQAVKKGNLDIGKHDMALEDMLELLDGKLESEHFMSNRIKELEESEEKLLLLMADYEEQMFLIDGCVKNISGTGSGGSAWAEQLDSVRGKLFEHMNTCGITVIADTHQMVNYEYHEVIQVVDTEEAALSRTVLEIYSPGFIYKGRVLKRAKVAAYRLTELNTK